AQQQPREHRRRVRRVAELRDRRVAHLAADKGRFRSGPQGSVPGHQGFQRQRRLLDQGPRAAADVPVPLQVPTERGLTRLPQRVRDVRPDASPTRRIRVHHIGWPGPEHEAHGRGGQPAGLPHRSDGESVRTGRRSVQDSAGHCNSARGEAVMLDRLTRLQLTIFAIVTVLTVGAISIFYLHVPAALGIGSYNVKANFVAGGGLYQNANVTYRGVTVGRVESVGLSNDGVVANMRLNSGTPVPENVTATVKSVSAVGEQYIDLVPPENPSSEKLRNGANIGKDRTAIGQDISGLLDESEKLVASIGDTRLQDLLRETFKAFNGSGPELARLIESSRLLVDEANNNYGQTTQLIDQAGPFLDAQIRGGDDIKSLADGLARLTGEVANADPQLRTTLQTVPGATEAANETFSGIRPSFPVLAANLANFGRIGVIYSKSLEQAL